MNAYTTKYLQSVDTIFIPMQKAGSEFRRLAGSIGMVVGKWKELSQSQIWFVTESKSPFPIFYMVHVSNTLLIAGVVPCECNTFLYKERPTFNVNPKTSGQLYGNWSTRAPAALMPSLASSGHHTDGL